MTLPVSQTTALTKDLGSGGMFNRIARRYDRLNRIMSLGMDARWRRFLAQGIAPIPPDGKILDVASGTGDVAILLAKTYPSTQLIGLDPSVEMMKIGEVKAEAQELSDRISFVEGDAQNLPYEDDTFHAALSW